MHVTTCVVGEGASTTRMQESGVLVDPLNSHTVLEMPPHALAGTTQLTRLHHSCHATRCPHLYSGGSRNRCKSSK